jgi:hypothetical protein
VIVWDAELGTSLADPETAALAQQYQLLEDSTADERGRRTKAETAVITASRRIWRTIGLLIQDSPRI